MCLTGSERSNIVKQECWVICTVSQRMVNIETEKLNAFSGLHPTRQGLARPTQTSVISW